MTASELWRRFPRFAPALWSDRHTNRASVGRLRRIAQHDPAHTTSVTTVAQSIVLAMRVAFAMSVNVRFLAGSQGKPAPSTT